ncbi:MAG: hypothetical protein AAFU73_07520 [Planctomycetota bacterium]
MEPSEKYPPAGRAGITTGGERRALRVALLCAFAALVHALLLSGRAGPVDDDYIVWRYARNWLEHGVYGFNVSGGVSDGVSSPLWFVACALALRAGLAPELFSPLVGIASFVLLAFVVARAAGRLAEDASGARAALLAGGLVALQPALGWHAWAGLGTVPCALFVGLGAAALVSGRDRTAGAWLAVAAGFRLEVAPVAIALALAGSRPTARRALALAGPSVVVAVLVTAARRAAFATWLPHTGVVKALPLGDELAYGGRYLVRSLGEGGLALSLAAAAALALGRTRASAGPAAPDLRGLGAAAAAALAAVLLVGGDWMVFGRFLAPWAPLGAFGCAALAVRLGGRRGALLVGAPAVGVALLGFAALPGAASERAGFERWWLAVGDALRERAAPDTSVALSPIGAIGWRSELPIVDVLGLTHDAFAGRPARTDVVRVKGHHRFDGAWVLDQEPDYLVLGNGIHFDDAVPVRINPWEADIVADPRFERDYVRRTVWIEGGEGRARLPYARRRNAPDL